MMRVARRRVKFFDKVFLCFCLLQNAKGRRSLSRISFKLGGATVAKGVSATSRRVEVGIHRCEFHQLISLHYSNASSFQSNPPPLRPRAQLFVGAFPRPADDLADLALSDRHFACWL
jgi:hypothetical protein